MDKYDAYKVYVLNEWRYFLKKRFIFLILTTLFFIFAVSCGSTSSNTSEPGNAKEPEGKPELMWQVKYDDKLNSVAISPDGKKVAVAEYLTVHIHSIDDKESIGVFNYEHSVGDLEFSKDGKLLGVGLGVFGAFLTDINSGENVRLNDGYDNKVTFSPDGKTIASGNRDGNAWIWLVKDGSKVKSLEANLQKKWITDLDFNPTGKYLAVTQWVDDGIVHIWDVQEAKIVKELTLNYLIDATTDTLIFSPDGQIMAAAVSKDFKDYIRLWSVNGFEYLEDLPVDKNVKDICFSSDGSIMVVASQKAVTVWDIPSKTLLFTLEQNFNESVSDWNVGLSITPNKEYIAVIRWDGTLELWKLPAL